MEVRSELPAGPGGESQLGHTLSLSGPQFPSTGSPERGCAACSGRGGGGSHLFVFLLLPPQDLCEVGPCILHPLPCHLSPQLQPLLQALSPQLSQRGSLLWQLGAWPGCDPDFAHGLCDPRHVCHPLWVSFLLWKGG